MNLDDVSSLADKVDDNVIDEDYGSVGFNCAMNVSSPQDHLGNVNNDDEPTAKICKLSTVNDNDFCGLDGTSVQDLGSISKFDPLLENVQIEETVKWITSSDDMRSLSEDVLDAWMKWSSEPDTHIDDGEIHFGDPVIRQQILETKTTFEKLSRHEIETAHAKCNPFETIIDSSIFQKRAAVKIANIDATLNFMFTDPRSETDEPLVTDLLYFADICAGPGGFSEYILWRNKWKAKGFGFTLPNDQDCNLYAFSAGKTETFRTYYGIKGDGNVFDPDNIRSLETYVHRQTNGTGVHFVMADGGFPVDEKNCNETGHKQLYLCQCLVALSLVREGGHFVVKLFDVFTVFSAGLVYLMYKCFKHITIMKPNTSHPASSERYLIGKFKRPNTDTVCDFLFRVNQEMWNGVHADCLEVVPYDIMKEDRNFFDYLCESNNTIGRSQIANLLKIVTFCSYKNRIESRQEEIRRKCLQAWMLPNEMPESIRQKKTTDDIFKELMKDWFTVKDFMLAPDRNLSNKSDLTRIFNCHSDWFFVPIDTVEGSEDFMRTFFISDGSYNLSYYSRTGVWQLLKNMAFEISDNTLLYGEIVAELNNDNDNREIVSTTLHIIDAIILGGVDIRNLPLHDRWQMCKNFAATLNKPSRLVHCGAEEMLTSPISCKPLYPLNEFRHFFDQLHRCMLNDGRERWGYKVGNCCGADRWYVPRGLLFFNNMKPNISKGFSRTYQKPYFVDRNTGKSFFQDQLDDPNSIFASCRTTFANRYVWQWILQSQVFDHQFGDGHQERIDDILYRCDLDEFIYSGNDCT